MEGYKVKDKFSSKTILYAIMSTWLLDQILFLFTWLPITNYLYTNKNLLELSGNEFTF